MTRDEAWEQYRSYAVTLGARVNADLQNDFNGWWNNASRDSHAYSTGPNETPFQGSIYDKSWADIWPQASDRLRRAWSDMPWRTVDSQSPEALVLYAHEDSQGGAPPVVGSPYIPLTHTVDPELPVALPALASVVTTMGATASADTPPTVGSVGLVDPSDNINYSTMLRSPIYGYGNRTPVSAPADAPGAAPATPWQTYAIIGAVAFAAFYLLKKT